MTEIRAAASAADTLYPNSPARREAFLVLLTDLADKGWDVDVEDEPEGGQPNGANQIEPSNAREWFTPERETHHRSRIVLTVVGPWEEGLTEYARQRQEYEREWQEKNRIAEEQAILRRADEIRARRAAEEPS